MPTMVNFPHAIKNLSCGIGHVGLVTSNGQLYMFGRGKEVKSWKDIFRKKLGITRKG